MATGVGGEELCVAGEALHDRRWCAKTNIKWFTLFSYGVGKREGLSQTELAADLTGE